MSWVTDRKDTGRYDSVNEVKDAGFQDQGT